MPDLFQQIHVLILQVRLLLLVPEVFGSRLGLSEGSCQYLNLLFVSFEGLQLLFADVFDSILMFLILFGLILLEKFVLDNRTGTQDDRLHLIKLFQMQNIRYQ